MPTMAGHEAARRTGRPRVGSQLVTSARGVDHVRTGGRLSVVRGPDDPLLPRRGDRRGAAPLVPRRCPTGWRRPRTICAGFSIQYWGGPPAPTASSGAIPGCGCATAPFRHRAGRTRRLVPPHGRRGAGGGLDPADEAEMLAYFAMAATHLVNRPDEPGARHRHSRVVRTRGGEDVWATANPPVVGFHASPPAPAAPRSNSRRRGRAAARLNNPVPSISNARSAAMALPSPVSPHTRSVPPAVTATSGCWPPAPSRTASSRLAGLISGKVYNQSAREVGTARRPGRPMGRRRSRIRRSPGSSSGRPPDGLRRHGPDRRCEPGPRPPPFGSRSTCATSRPPRR